MIDSIKGIFKTGDQIILICTDGGRVEGVIQNITDDVILLKNKNNLIKGVKGSMIEYFEQPENTAINETSVSNASGKTDLKIIDKIPLETLLQKDPRLRKRFPNLAKEQDAKKENSYPKENSSLSI